MEAVATAALDEKERERQEQIKKLQNETCFIGHPFGVGVMNFKFMMGQITGYGMTAIFIYYLYAAAPAGVGLTKVQASQIITLDAALASIFSIVGSFMADRVFGNRRAYRSPGLSSIFPSRFRGSASSAWSFTAASAT